MRKTHYLLVGIIMIATMFLFAGCNKDDDGSNSNSSVQNEPQTEGIYLGIVGFNSELFVKDISLLNGSTVSSFTNFINGLKSGNGTGLYYADYKALKMMENYKGIPKLKNVALVTFTDGLDNISLASDEYNPQHYGSTSAYRNALHEKIVGNKIHGVNVAAYTIGLKGNDVTDETAFMETLEKLASSENNVFQVANMNETMQRFSEIAANLYSVSTTVSLGVDVPGGYDEGQLLRFTFENGATATTASTYIEATYHRTSSERVLNNITYHGFGQNASSITSSSRNGAYYHFVFDNLTNTDGSIVSQSVLNKIQLWKKTSTGNWDKETEFDPSGSTTITEDKSSALIVLVLDCTNSLGSDFSKMQQAGINFVKGLVTSGGSNGGGNNNGGDNGGDNGGGSSEQPTNEGVVPTGTMSNNNVVVLVDADTAAGFKFEGGFSKGTDVAEYSEGYYWHGHDTTYWYYACANKILDEQRVGLPYLQILMYTVPAENEQVNVNISYVKLQEMITDSTSTTWVGAAWLEGGELGFMDDSQGKASFSIPFKMVNSKDESIETKLTVRVVGKFNFQFDASK